MQDVDTWDGLGCLPTLYSKTATGAVNVWICWVTNEAAASYVCVSWGQEDGAMQSSRFAVKAKNIGRSNETTVVEQARLEAIALWKKQVKKKYSPERSKVLTTLNLKPMLAKSFDDHGHKVRYPAHAQPKLDGLRCLAYRKEGRVFLQSRGGDPYVVQHVMEELERVLPDNLMLDGELYIHGVSLQVLNSYVRRPQEDSLMLTYNVYDAATHAELGRPHDMLWTERRAHRHNFFAQNIRHMVSVRQVEEVSIQDEAAARAAHAHFVSLGFEGAIIRYDKDPYRFGYRSDCLLKMKHWQDAEFLIVGHDVGKGKFENVPLFKCRTEAGAEFWCAPKGTDAERAALLAAAPNSVGKWLKVKFFDWTNDGVPHYPVGLEIRHPSDR